MITAINSKMNGRRNLSLIFLFFFIVLLVFFFLDLFLGSVSIPFGEIVRILSGNSSSEIWNTIILNFRLPKAITAVAAGCALSVSGLQMQTVFRNPLAGPYVLGISSGASLGVAIVVLGIASVGLGSLTGLATSLTLAGAAWVGSMIILMVVLAVSIRVKDIMTILILGMMFGSAISALVSVLQFFSSESLLKAFVLWTMGSLASTAGMQLGVFLVAVSFGLLLSFLSFRVLDVLNLGEAHAKSVGLNILGSRILIFISTSLLAGSVTAFCGPIGFIGIAVPHVARIIFRSANHSILLPATALIGACMLLLCDIVSQLPGMNQTLPLNSITALLGIPIVVYVVFKNRKFTGL